MMAGRNTQLAAVTLILLLAAITRILNIDGPALWTDEGFTYYTFKVDLLDALKEDRHPPFYFYSLHGWVDLAGDTILAMRWWSFLPSMLSIAIAFQIGRELLRHRPGLDACKGVWTLPVLAALMMALTDGENYLAQELRMYTWHVFFAALVTLFYLKYIRYPSRNHALLWVVSGTFLIYTHYFGAYILAVQGLHSLLFLQGRQRMGAIGSLAAISVLFMPWFLLVVLEQFGQDNVCVNCPSPDNWSILLGFRGKWFGEQWPLTGLLFFIGMVTVVYNEQWHVKLHPFYLTAYLVLLIVAPIAVTYGMGHREVIFFAHRLTQITVPITLLLALGIVNLQRTARAVVVVALLLYGITTVDWYRIKVPWHTVTQLAADYAKADDLVLAEVGPEESALLYYLDHMLPEGTSISTFPFWADMARFNYYEGTLPTLLNNHLAQSTEAITSIWLIYFSFDPGMMNKVEQAGFTRTMTRTYEHVNDSVISVYRYDALPEEPLAEFESRMALLAADIDPNDLRIDLWWQADEVLTENYVVSAFVLDADGILVAQFDSPPANGDRPTHSWKPGEVIYDPHVLQPSSERSTLTSGPYTVGVKIYAIEPSGELEVYRLINGNQEYYPVGELEYIKP